MVASISARGNAASASRYYGHLQHDDYYSRDGDPPGRWAGRGAERLSLDGPVTRTDLAPNFYPVLSSVQLLRLPGWAVRA
ncbi:relaxase domain-containing protein, partial [Bradyrhizobium oligotrophicum]|uniref:relaxase domain-containing protein n=1 Tax=Bradyrhizobium oligotrophicum TaxID=44255 RepID=UPI003EBFB297